LHVFHWNNPLRQPVFRRWKGQFGGRVRRKATHPVAEREQALNPSQDAGAGDRSQVKIDQLTGEALQVGEGYAGEGAFWRDLEAVQNQGNNSSVYTDLGTFGAKFR
jgi:hypothetical protein